MTASKDEKQQAKMRNNNQNMETIIWHDGDLVEMSKAKLQSLNRGDKNAKGLFETIRVEKGHVFFLKEHLDRLGKSAKYFKINLPDIKWNTIINQVLETNSLDDSIVRLKIVLASENIQNPEMPVCDEPSIIVACEEYTPPSNAEYARGWSLKTCDTSFAPLLSAHKLLELSFFYDARQAARFDQMDDSIILDSDGYVSETSICSLLFFYHDTWFAPDSDYQLPGITLDKTIHYLEKYGAEVIRRPTSVMHLLCSDAVFVLNSLIGVMPVCDIDREEVYDIDPVLAEFLRKKLFSCSV